ncbi:MAG: TIGR02099 family protein [Candidatus Competibacteraceae bacterium]|nr:TIGR02099 family protein [Candidatus Competibacteraceae bacterium]
MWHPHGMPRRLLRWTRRLLLALLLPALLLAGYAQWWVLPRLDGYRDDLAGALSDYLRAPVRIEGLTAVRDGWRLGLRLRDISLQDPGRDATLAHFSRAVIALDLWRSLREWRPVLNRVRLEGVNLTLEQGPDGAPRLLEVAGDARTATALPEFGRWLFSLPRLEIVGEQLAVRRPDGVGVQLEHPYLQLQQIPTGQRLTFAAELPAGSGERLQLEIERAAAPASAPGTEQGTFLLRADRLELAGWPLPLTFDAGQAALELSGDWRDWRPSRFDGRVRLKQAALTADPRAALLKTWLARWSDSEARFDWRRQDDGWQLQGQLRLGDDKGQSIRQPSFELNRTALGWQGRALAVQAQDVLAWATPWLDEPARRWLIPLEVRGELPELAFQADAALADYYATVQLRDVGFQSVRKLPGFDGVSGVLKFGAAGGRLELDSRRVRVDTAGLFRAPLALTTMTGAVDWWRSDSGLRLESDGLAVANADLNGRFWGSVLLPDADKPLLDIKGQYWEVRGDQAKRYLPVAVIPPKAVAWLDRALVGGRVLSGDVVFRGPPARFPFDGGEGLFETRFRVENAILDYMPGWPRFEQGRATVTFRNRSLRVEAEAGRLADGTVENAAVRIDDLDKVVIEAKGRVKGSGASMWQVLADSPAGRALGEDLPALRIRGDTTLDLQLTLPLDSRPGEVRGQVNLQDNTIGLTAWNIDLDRLRGAVRFTEAGLEAKNVQALLQGQPIQLDLALIGREGQRDLQAHLRSRLALQALLDEPAALLETYLNGKSEWEAVLTIPTQRLERPNAPAFALELASNLRGTAVYLPAPLGKTAAETRQFKLGVQPSVAGTTLKAGLEYGPLVRAALELGDFPRQPRFERGELRVNAGAATLPDGPGLTVVADLPRWSPQLPAGRAALKPPAGNAPAKRRAGSAKASGSKPTAGAWRFLRGVEARIGELVLGGRSFSQVTVQAKRQQDGLTIDCEGERLSGRITLPDEPTPQRPVRADWQRLFVGPSVERPDQRDSSAEVDPRQLPPLVLNVADLRVGEAALGRLRVSALPRPDGIRLPEIRLDAESQRIEASGDWWSSGAGQQSKLNAALRGRSLGETLAAFGYPGSGVERGETEADLAVEWKAGLPDFALEQLDGTLKLQVGPGQLRDIKPGLGRLIGMLNVQNLTRRLNFDFSDLFQPGMGFDRISGEFAFKHGNARTENLVVEAPSARIEIWGRIGLQARDFDQIVTVVPNFGGTLPVAGAIAGGPVVGAAVFVAERLLQKDIEHATRYRYALKGSWDNPVMESLQQSPAPAQAEGFASDH